MQKSRFFLRNAVKSAVAVLAAVVFFASCEKTDDPTDPDNPGNNTQTTSIVGKWMFEKGTVKELAFESGVPQPLQNAIRDELLEMYDEDYAGSTWEFQSSGKYVLTWADGEIDDESTYTVNGNILTGIDPDGFFVTGQYSISGNKLYWDVDVLASPDTEELIEKGVTKAIFRLTLNKE